MKRIAAAVGPTPARAAAGGAPRARGGLLPDGCGRRAALHWQHLRTRPEDFDPAVRDRLFAGAPACPRPYWLRRSACGAGSPAEAAKLFQRVDVLLAPATPVVAPLIRAEDPAAGRRAGSRTSQHRASTHSPSASSACRWWSCRYTPPWICPLVSRSSRRPGGEATALRVAAYLERASIVSSGVAT